MKARISTGERGGILVPMCFLLVLMLTVIGVGINTSLLTTARTQQLNYAQYAAEAALKTYQPVDCRGRSKSQCGMSWRHKHKQEECDDIHYYNTCFTKTREDSLNAANSTVHANKLVGTTNAQTPALVRELEFGYCELWDGNQPGCSGTELYCCFTVGSTMSGGTLGAFAPCVNAARVTVALEENVNLPGFSSNERQAGVSNKMKIQLKIQKGVAYFNKALADEAGPGMYPYQIIDAEWHTGANPLFVPKSCPIDLNEYQY